MKISADKLNAWILIGKHGIIFLICHDFPINFVMPACMIENFFGKTGALAMSESNRVKDKRRKEKKREEKRKEEMRRGREEEDGEMGRSLVAKGAEKHTHQN